MSRLLHGLLSGLLCIALLHRLLRLSVTLLHWLLIILLGITLLHRLCISVLLHGLTVAVIHLLTEALIHILRAALLYLLAKLHHLNARFIGLHELHLIAGGDAACNREADRLGDIRICYSEANVDVAYFLYSA